MQLNDQTELRPWAIVSDDGGEGSLALWRMALPATENASPSGTGELALAIFSQRAPAEAYRQLNSSATARVVQLDELQTVQVLLAAYQQGLRYAALDPGTAAARQIFILRDVLAAAQRKLADKKLS